MEENVPSIVVAEVASIHIPYTATESEINDKRLAALEIRKRKQAEVIHV